MNTRYVAKQNDYRTAFPAVQGESYTFAVPAGTTKVYFAITLNFFPGKTRFQRFCSRLQRRRMKPATHAVVTVEMGGRVERIKILLSGFSKDHFLLNDLWDDWFELFIPVSPPEGGPLRVGVALADERGRTLEGGLYRDKVLLTEPIFLRAKNGKNVIYMTMESLSDMDYLLEKKIISPDTHALYQAVFKDFHKEPNSVSQVDWTFPAVISCHTGLLPSQHRMYNSERIKMKLDRLDSRIVTIANLLKQRGYITFSSNLGKLQPENGFSKGIDVYFKPPSSLGHVEYTGDDKWVLKKLQQFRENCFIHIHYDRLHAPLYSTTGPWSRVRTDAHPLLDDKGGMRDPERLYDANLRFLLHEIHNVISYLKLHGQFDDTVLILTGDHGTDIGEWAAMRQKNPFIESRSRVPYLVSPRSRVTTRNATLRPFFEICDLFGFDLPDYFRLLPQADKELGQYVYSETFLKSRNDLYVLNISDKEYRYILNAEVDMNDFSIRRVEAESVVHLADQATVDDAAIIARYVLIRKRFFEMNQNFHRSFRS